MNDLKTPCLLLDIERVRKNAARMSDIATRNGVRLRPHVKTHKCVEIARIQTKGQTGAITVSTLAEARGFSKNGFADITYAVPIEAGKFAEAAEIVRSGVKLNLITDDAETVEALNEFAGRENVKFDVFLKVDCGYHRCGVEPESPEALEIPRQISDARNLSFVGILTHAGHSYHARSKDELLSIAQRERDSMVELKEKLINASVEVPTVSIGSTPTMHTIDHLTGIDEIRPGNYIFFDAFQATLGSCTFDDCALTVLAAVVHRDRSRKKIILDAGAIALSKDRGAIEFDPACGYGHILDLAGNEMNLRIDSVSQEHGTFHVDDDAVFDKLKVGTRVRVLANHSCLTSAQHAHFNVMENGQIVDRWETIKGW